MEVLAFLSFREQRRIRSLLSGCYREQIEEKGRDRSWRILTSLQILIHSAGITERRAIITGLITAVIFIGGAVISTGLRHPLPLLLCLCGVGIEYGVLKKKSHARAERFERDYTALLLSLASSSKSGIDPGSSLAQAERLFAKTSVIREELRKYNDAIARGTSEEVALSHFGATVAHPDIPLFREAFLLARREGSSLSESLHRLARVTRARQSFRRKSASAVAMQKLSAFGIVACCLAIGLFQLISNPQGFLDTWHHPMGQRLLGFGLGLITFGLCWMLRLCRVRL